MRTDMFKAAADVGLRRARMGCCGGETFVGGRFTPYTHRSYSEANVTFSGSGPGGADTMFDKLTTAVTGTRLDPATIMGFPTSTPPDWAAQPDGDVKFAFYTEGINAGAVRAGVVLGGGALVLGGLLGLLLARRSR
jgi:hypothetical protein